MSFKIVPLGNCKFLPATVKLLETFLEVILCNPFQLLCCIVNEVCSITKAPLTPQEFCLLILNASHAASQSKLIP